MSMHWVGYGALLVLLSLTVLGTVALLRNRRSRGRKPLAPAREGDTPGDFLYDAFASYATDPDGALVRDVEVFVESLRENILVAPVYRRTLELCVDGSDFSLPRKAHNRAEGTTEDQVFDLIRAYMEKCRHFVLFVGPRSAHHPWINRELSWWLANRDEESILIAVTHGHDPKAERQQTFPESVVQKGLDQRIWIDLRGFGAGKGVSLLSARPYEEERLRLTAALLGPDVSASDLIAGWKLAAARLRRRQRLARGVLATAALAAALTLGWSILQWRDSSRDARASGLALVSRQSSGTDANRRLDGLAYAASSLAEQPSPLGSATLIEAARALPKHLRSIVHDQGGKAADIVRFVDGDRLILSAGFTKVLQLTAAGTGQVLGRVALSGRARSIAIHSDRPLIAVATQGGLDLISYQPGAVDPEPRVIGRTALGARVQAVLFEPGGETLLAGDFAGYLARYRLSDAGASPWRPVRTVHLTDPDGAGVGVSGLALDPTAGRLAVSGILGRIDCLDAGDWTRRTGSFKHSSEIFAMTSSPDGHFAAAADANGEILLFRPASCEVTGRIAPPVTEDAVARDLDGMLRSTPRSERPFVGIAFSADGSLLGVASHDRTVRIYTADQGVLTHVLVHPAMARAVAFSSSGSLVTTGDNGGRVEIWDTAATVESWRLGGVEAFAVDPGGRWIAVSAAKGPLTLLEPLNGRPLAKQRPADEAFRGGIGALLPTADGHLAARIPASHLAFVWDLSSPGPLSQLPPPHPLAHPNDPGHVATVAALAAGPGPQGLVTGEGFHGHSVRVWDGATPTQRLSFDMSDTVHSVAAGGEIIAATDASGLVRVVAAASGNVVGELRLPGSPQAFALAPDGRHLFAGFQGKTGSGGCLCQIGQKETLDLRERLALFFHRPPGDDTPCAAVHGALHCRSALPGPPPISALFSPRGDAVAVAVAGTELDDGSLFLLRQTDRWHPTLLSTAGRVRTLDFTTDGTLLAAGGHSRSVEIFDLEKSVKIGEIPLSNPVLGVRFLPGPEKRILTLDGFEVGFLRLWDWRPQSLIAAACERWPESFIPVRNPALPAPRSRRELCGQ